MGLLAPLYALAALAIAGPILFHLIRRQPQGRVLFSSLMFLRSSPPRLTRKSRLDNLLLLLLRVLALVMVALAFSRPYWRQKDLVSQTAPARTVALLIDTSGSMQRSDVWQAAIQEAGRVLAGLTADDQVALFTIDSRLNAVVPLGQGLQSDSNPKQGDSLGLVKQALKELKPTWNAGKLASGLIGVAEQLSVRSLGAEGSAISNAQIVLISDFHMESGIEELQGYAWPDSIPVDLRIVGSKSPSNARATLMQSDESGVAASAERKVRIENNSQSTKEALSLLWVDDKGKAQGPQTSIQVPTGQVRVVTLPPQPEGSRQVRLEGDDWSGDNELFVPRGESVTQRILYCGTQPKQAEEDLSYFLSQAPLSNAMFRREVINVKAEELQLQAVQENVVAVVIEPNVETYKQAEFLRSVALVGTSVIVVLTEQSGDGPEAAKFLESLWTEREAVPNQTQVSISEAERKQHAMIASVDYRNSVFGALADPRFNDFSKIRIWKHRKVEWPGSIATTDTPSRANATEENKDPTNGASQASLQVLARLDDGAAWLIRQQAGKGNIWLLTSGWQTTESSFALSSKFIPVMMNLVDPNPRQLGFTRVVDVGQAVEVEDQPPFKIIDQSGSELDSRAIDEATGKITFEKPGLYSVRGSKWSQQLAVQLPISESRLTPMDSSVLQQFGLATEKLQTDQEIADRLRQMKIEELEQQQKIWKWILVTGLAILLVETFVAGWAAKNM